MESNNTQVSELRQDLVSGDWVVMAKKRGKRPERPKKCPFCYPEIKKQEIISQTKNIIVIENKYPAFKPAQELQHCRQGPFAIIDGVGFHEVIILKNHNAQINQINLSDLIDAYQKRYLALMNRKFVNYISIFHNHGKQAGASIQHPHSQLIASPVIDPDIHRSLDGSQNYFRKHRQCVHCAMIEFEKSKNKRVLYENQDFIGFVPFVSRVAYEIRIFPKEHKAYFERINSLEKTNLADALQKTLKKLHLTLDNPAYNFFLHTAPCDGLAYDHYHWHFEILPKTSIWAGFELGAGIEICSITPEQAANKLKSI